MEKYFFFSFFPMKLLLSFSFATGVLTQSPLSSIYEYIIYLYIQFLNTFFILPVVSLYVNKKVKILSHFLFFCPGKYFSAQKNRLDSKR